MPDMGASLPSGVLTFLFTDIEGATQRWEAAPELMGAAIARHDQVIRSEIVARGGHIFKTAGDAFHAVFALPSSALAAALAAQLALAEQDFAGVGGLTVRMAIYAGPAEARNDDYFGPGANRCARLLSVAYGGQILVSGGVADLVRGFLPPGSSLLNLGRHRLRDVPEPETIHQLVAPDLRTAFPTLRSLGTKVQNLPRQLTSFIRRDGSLADIKHRLSLYRLVTLIGSGGAGKTRTALEVGSDLLSDALEGVWFVELAPLEDPKLVDEAVCSTIGIPVGGSRSAAASAAGYLSQKRALLILDNCEHLLDATARLVEALMRSCPSLLVLATSRESLGVQGESPYRVPSLEVPPGTDDITAAAANQHDAVRLFVERASLLVEGFALSDANAAAVSSICRQLDGMPMAIELIVPQLRMLQPKGLAARVRERLLVVKGGRTELPRHQTLRALFDWSYNLLGESERALFRRLSVFAGGWSLNAAAAVATGPLVAQEDVFDILSALVDKSLAVVDMAAGEPRYGYLQTVRQYALGKLRETQERGYRSRLAKYMVSVFAEASQSWPVTPTHGWLAIYEPELDNLRASLDWAFSSEGDPDVGVELCSFSVRMWDELSLFAERERYLSMAFNGLDAGTQPATLARLWLGRVSDSAHGDQTNFDRALRAADLFRKAGDQHGLGEALAKAGAALERPDTTANAEPYLMEALAILKPLGPTKQLAGCLRSLAVARYFVSDFEGARPLIAESQEVAKLIGDARGYAAVQIAASELEFASGSAEEAIALTQAMLSGKDCNPREMILGLSNLAAYLIAADRMSEGRHAALEGLREARSLGWGAAIVRTVEHLALVAALEGRLELAAKLLGHGIAFYAAGTASREFTELATYDRLSALLAANLLPDRLRELMAQGASWGHDRATDEALSLADPDALRA